MRKYKRIICFFLAVSSVVVNSQNEVDTFAIATSHISEGEFDKAINILEVYCGWHKEDVHASQLLAISYYWNKQYNKADSTYSANIIKHPNAHYLLLDYGRMLFELGQVQKAEYYLTKYHKIDLDDTYTLESLGYIDLWKGDYKKSLQNFNKIVALYPSNENALNMVLYLNRIISPKLGVNFKYLDDSQPLISGEMKVEYSNFYSRWIQPEIMIGLLNFSSEETSKNVPQFYVKNKLSFFNSSTQLSVSIGAIQDNDVELLGNITIEQKLLNHLRIKLVAEKSPYFYTASSINESVLYSGYSASVIWERERGINAIAFAGNQIFFDGNQLSTYYGWGLSPAFGWNKLRFKLGYGFNYSHSQENKYVNKYSLDYIITNFTSNNIEGSYSPYFTPTNQNIHSALGIINYKIMNNMSMELKGSVGIYSFSDIPYLYLDNDENNMVFINRGFHEKHLVPYEVGVNINYQIGQRIMLATSYKYVENFFYFVNTINLSIKYTFI